MGVARVKSDSIEPSVVNEDDFLDESVIAFWALGIILSCLACTCYALGTPDRSRKATVLIVGTIGVIFYIRAFIQRLERANYEFS
eukprot:m.4640 g.4640  ORF g.4640 m.4640 type:complete len:85 (+) comp3037_c0_seq1:168-422(+)